MCLRRFAQWGLGLEIHSASALVPIREKFESSKQSAFRQSTIVHEIFFAVESLALEKYSQALNAYEIR